MADPDVTHPGDSSILSQFPANERGSRVALLALLNGTATWGGTAGGSADALTATVSMTGWSLVAGATVDLIAADDNATTTPTLNVNGSGAVTTLTKDGGALVAGDIAAGRQHTLKFDGTNWRLQDPVLSAISQAAYDAMFPVGFVQLRYDSTTPVVPGGITATWAAITDTDAYLRINNGGGGGAGGSATTPLPDHLHGAGTLVASANPGAWKGESSGTDHVASDTHTHTVTGNTGNPTTHPTIAIEPKYRDVRAYRRTA